MPKAISSNDAKQRWGSVVSYVTDQDDEVVVESHGKPTAVVMSYAAFQVVQALREQQRRRDILDRLRSLEGRLAAQNHDLSEADAMALADRFSHELIDDLAAEGVLTFERDGR